MNDISVKLLYTDRNPRVQRGRELKVAPRIKDLRRTEVIFSLLFLLCLLEEDSPSQPPEIHEK